MRETTKVADAWIHIDGMGSKRLTMSGKLTGKTKRIFDRSGARTIPTPLYAETNPAFKALVDALRGLLEAVDSDALEGYLDELNANQALMTARITLALWIGKEGK